MSNTADFPTQMIAFTSFPPSRKIPLPLPPLAHRFCFPSENTKILFISAEKSNGAGRVHLGGSEFSRSAAVIGVNVKFRGVDTDCHLAVVGVKVQQLVICRAHKHTCNGEYCFKSCLNLYFKCCTENGKEIHVYTIVQVYDTHSLLNECIRYVIYTLLCLQEIHLFFTL